MQNNAIKYNTQSEVNFIELFRVDWHLGIAEEFAA